MHAVVAAILWTPVVGRRDWKAKVWFAVLSVLFVSKELRDLYLKGTSFSVWDVVAGYAGIVLAETFKTGFGNINLKKTGRR